MSRQQRIYDALFNHLAPDPLIVENESNQHNVPKGSETHFKVIAVSEKFETLRPVARHRQVNQLLTDEFSSGLHALSLHLFTPSEWQEKKTGARASPACQQAKHTD
jgi:BolA protein